MVMTSIEKTEQIILASLRELAEDLDKPALQQATAETALFGPEGALDSLALVQLIADLEARVAEEFGQDVIIADERAMSRSKSPFRTVATLRDYLAELLSTEEG